ncbi:MAG: type II secretion system protein [Candidatus Paceibacterota bacterium]|jgi:type II secretory pathway pseudopilin PulG
MFKYFKKQNKKNISRGFTLVETLVAIGIFSTSILVMMVVLGAGISDTNYAKRKIIATYLAQEGIEYIRNIRDTYELFPTNIGGDGWVDFKVAVSNCISNSNNKSGCLFYDGNLIPGDEDPMNSIKILPCEDTDNLCTKGILYYDPATGRYNPGQANFFPSSGFTRSIIVEFLGNVDEIKVSSTVHWKQGSGDQSVTFSENLFNWIQ